MARLTRSSFITRRGGYDRNHSEIPLLDTAIHRVTITGAVDAELSLSPADLATRFSQHEVLCALQCAGNRRHTMRTRLKEVSGIDWLDGAVMNCVWRGPRLRDVLRAAGIGGELCGDKGYRGHVACECDLVPCEDCPTYGGSIPLARAMLDEGDCILALEVSASSSLSNVAPHDGKR
jgi:sulfite oxidase